MQVIKPLREVSKLTNGVVPELVPFTIGMDHNGDTGSPDYEESTDLVDELRPPVPKPRAMPRHFSAPSALKMGVRNGSHYVTEIKEREVNDDREESDDIYENVLLPGTSENHPTPSRSAPAPPNAAEHQPQKVS